MDLFTVFFIALGLAMDAFAVSIAFGVITKRNRTKKALLLGFMFGGFQMIMPIIGWSAGYTFRSFISNIDHWIAFVLLFFIGIKMIYEALKIEDLEHTETDTTALILLGIAIATSIDALAVGISFAFLQVSIVFPILVIGIITFVLSFLGIFIGNKYGRLFEKKIEVFGGLILVFIGFKILVSHLLM